MESKKTKELRSRKLSVRSRLMAAVAMLLVSTIMLTSTTYAWFVLSTAPEVKGMSTTVGANGSLEIALLNDSLDTDAISSGVGTSVAATEDATVSNVTWGNIVDLSSVSYGLNNAKLYPAALNFSAAGNTTLADLYSSLKIPAYGVDGRVAELTTETMSGKYINGTYQGDPGYYGVRVIGTGEEADPAAFAFNAAKNNYSSYMSAAKTAAQASLNSYGPQLVNLAMKHGIDENATYTASEVAAITDAVAGLRTAADDLKLAIQYAYEAYRLSDDQEAAADPTAVELSVISDAWTEMATYIAAYSTLDTTIQGVTISGGTTSGEGENQTTTYTWDEIKPALNALIDTEGMTINGYTMARVSAAANAVKNNSATTEDSALLESLQQSPVVAVKNGLYTQVANFVDTYTSNAFSMTIPVGFNFNIAGATMRIEKANGVTEAYITPMNNAVTGLPAPSGDATDLITTTYGYVVDLALRSNATTDLMLSAPAQRVSGDAETQGYGSIYVMPTTTANEDVVKVAKALRVVFVQNTVNDYQILGVAGLAATDSASTVAPMAEGTSIYALHMYDYSVDTNGGIKLTAQKGTDMITGLTADSARCISVLVYLDGNYVDYAMNEVAGTLNLQFASSVTLTPMDYSGYVTSTSANTLTISGADNATTVVAGEDLTLTAKYGGQEITGTVEWSSDSENATVTGTSGTATVHGVTASEEQVTITAKYTTDGGIEKTATYTVTVTSAP